MEPSAVAGSSTNESGASAAAANAGPAAAAAASSNTYQINGIAVNWIPGLTPYGPQHAIMSGLIKSANRAENALLEAPTGAGKTLGLLCASLAWQREAKRMVALAATDERRAAAFFAASELSDAAAADTSLLPPSLTEPRVALDEDAAAAAAEGVNDDDDYEAGGARRRAPVAFAAPSDNLRDILAERKRKRRAPLSPMQQRRQQQNRARRVSFGSSSGGGGLGVGRTHTDSQDVDDDDDDDDLFADSPRRPMAPRLTTSLTPTASARSTTSTTANATAAAAAAATAAAEAVPSPRIPFAANEASPLAPPRAHTASAPPAPLSKSTTMTATMATNNNKANTQTQSLTTVAAASAPTPATTTTTTTTAAAAATAATARTTQGAQRSNSRNAVPREAPRIYYAARTHSQLAQVAAELKRAPYTVRSVTLASRDKYCVHPEVRDLPSSEMTQACMERLDARSCRFKEPGTVSSLAHSAAFDAHGSLAVHDIEELAAYGARLGSCPYYGIKSLMGGSSVEFAPGDAGRTMKRIATKGEGQRFGIRRALFDTIYPENAQHVTLNGKLKTKNNTDNYKIIETLEHQAAADVILCPYIYLLDAGIRETMRIDVRDAIVIIDEGHNIEDAAREAASMDLTMTNLEATRDEFRAALDHPGFDEELRLPPGVVLPLSAVLMALCKVHAWARHHCERLRTAAQRVSRHEATRVVHGGAPLQASYVCVSGPRADAVNAQAAAAAAAPFTLEAVYTLQGQLGRLLREWQAFRADLLQRLQADESVDRSDATRKERGEARRRQRAVRRMLNLLSFRCVQTTAALLRVMALALDERTASDYRIVFRRKFPQEDEKEKAAKAAAAAAAAAAAGGGVKAEGGGNVGLSFRRADRYGDALQPQLQSNQPQEQQQRLVAHRPRSRRRGGAAAGAGNDGAGSNANVAPYEDSVSFWCMNPAVAFSALRSARSVVLASGTLAPLDSFASELGVPFSVRVNTAHVVNTQKQALLVAVGKTANNLSIRSVHANSLDTTHQDGIARALYELASNVPHGMLVFFPSYTLMNIWIERWKETKAYDTLNTIKTIIIEPKDSADLPAVLRAHEREARSSRGSMLCAVYRGKVSEGVDFADRRARLVVLIGVPFPSIADLNVRLKRDYNDTRILREQRDRESFAMAQALQHAASLRAAAAAKAAAASEAAEASNSSVNAMTNNSNTTTTTTTSAINRQLSSTTTAATATAATTKETTNNTSNQSNSTTATAPTAATLATIARASPNLPQVLHGGEWYELQAWRALNQALGRCIRHRNDFGAIVLLDERHVASQGQMHGRLSRWAAALLRSARNVGACAHELRAFYTRNADLDALVDQRDLQKQKEAEAAAAAKSKTKANGSAVAAAGDDDDDDGDEPIIVKSEARAAIVGGGSALALSAAPSVQRAQVQAEIISSPLAERSDMPSPAVRAAATGGGGGGGATLTPPLTRARYDSDVSPFAPPGGVTDDDEADDDCAHSSRSDTRRSSRSGSVVSPAATVVATVSRSSAEAADVSVDAQNGAAAAAATNGNGARVFGDVRCARCSHTLLAFHARDAFSAFLSSSGPYTVPDEHASFMPRAPSAAALYDVPQDAQRHAVRRNAFHYRYRTQPRAHYEAGDDVAVIDNGVQWCAQLSVAYNVLCCGACHGAQPPRCARRGAAAGEEASGAIGVVVHGANGQAALRLYADAVVITSY